MSESDYQVTLVGHGSRYVDVAIRPPARHAPLSCCEPDIHWVQWSGTTTIRLDINPSQRPFSECEPLLRLPTFAGEQRLCSASGDFRVERSAIHGTDEVRCSVTQVSEEDLEAAWKSCAEMRLSFRQLTMRPGSLQSFRLSDADAHFDVELGLPDGYRQTSMPGFESSRVVSFQRSEAPTIQVELNGTIYMKATEGGDRFDRVMTGPSWYERPCKHVVEREELSDGYLVVCQEAAGQRAIRFIRADADKISCSISGTEVDRDALSVCKSMRARRRK
jgi:hypothetical protein